MKIQQKSSTQRERNSLYKPRSNISQTQGAIGKLVKRKFADILLTQYTRAPTMENKVKVLI